MQIDWQSLQNSLLLWGLLCCVVPFILLLIVTLWAFANAPKLLRGDETTMRRDFERLKAKHADLNTDQLVNQIINRQALRSGIVGAVTSVGGLPLLPLGLTIDMFTTARMHNEMLRFLGWAYQPQASDTALLDLPEALSIQVRERGEAMLVEGSQQISRYAVRRITVQLVEKSFAKLIPGIGLVIGFIVNYVTTQGVGRLAARWYAGKFRLGGRRGRGG